MEPKNNSKWGVTARKTAAEWATLTAGQTEAERRAKLKAQAEEVARARRAAVGPRSASAPGICFWEAYSLICEIIPPGYVSLKELVIRARSDLGDLRRLLGYLYAGIPPTLVVGP